MKRDHLYFYQCLEAAKYPRSGYTLNYSLKAVKEDVSRNYITPTRVKVRLIKEDSEEYVEQIIKMKGGK